MWGRLENEKWWRFKGAMLLASSSGQQRIKLPTRSMRRKVKFCLLTKNTVLPQGLQMWTTAASPSTSLWQQWRKEIKLWFSVMIIQTKWRNFWSQILASIHKLDINSLSLTIRCKNSQQFLTVVPGTVAKIIEKRNNGSLAKNIVSEAIINLTSRLSFANDGVKLVTLHAEDFIQACRAFCHESEPSTEDTTEPDNKWIW